jgi:hypothetical protein
LKPASRALGAANIIVGAVLRKVSTGEGLSPKLKLKNKKKIKKKLFLYSISLSTLHPFTLNFFFTV